MSNKILKYYTKHRQSFFIILLSLLLIFSISLFKFKDNYEKNNTYWQCRNSQWVKKGRPLNNPPTVSCLAQNTKGRTPIVVVESFYDWFLQSNKEYVAYNNVKDTLYFTNSFARKIAKKSFVEEGSPFYCKENSNIGSFNAYQIYEKDDKAIVSVYQNYIDHQEKIDFVLKKVNGIWKINTVQCTSLLEATKKLSQSYN